MNPPGKKYCSSAVKYLFTSSGVYIKGFVKPHVGSDKPCAGLVLL